VGKPTSSDSPLQKPYVWAFTTYFAEGFPYTVIRTLSSVFFRDRGMSLEAIGVTSIFGLPWVLKFLWGPLVDSFSTKRNWLLSSQAVLCIFFLAVALLAPLDSLGLIAGLFFLAAFVAATHDIAIDGYYLEALDKEGQARYVGYRVMAYRIAMMTGTGVIATVGAVYNWFAAFLLSSLIMAALLTFHWLRLPECGTRMNSLTMGHTSFLKHHAGKIILAVLLVIGLRAGLGSELFLSMQESYPVLKKLTFSATISLLLFAGLLLCSLFRNKIRSLILKDPDSFYANAFLSFMDRPAIGPILAFIIFIRAGEFMLSAMCAPFLIDLGLKLHYGWLTAGAGLPASIAGALIGGWMISRYSLAKMIWPFLLAQNLTNVVYMVLALNLEHYLILNTGNATPEALSGLAMLAVAATHTFDQFSGGLGTAVLMTFLMRICQKEFKASHYAIGTGLMSVSGLYSGVVSGFLTSWLGYGYFFGISFLISIPGMALIFWVPLRDENKG